VRKVLLRRFAGLVAAGAASGAQARMGRMFTFEADPRASGRRPGPGRRGAPPAFDDDVVEGTATEVPPKPRELP
jgi:hypothetical protein